MPSRKSSALRDDTEIHAPPSFADLRERYDLREQETGEYTATELAGLLNTSTSTAERIAAREVEIGRMSVRSGITTKGRRALLYRMLPDEKPAQTAAHHKKPRR